MIFNAFLTVQYFTLTKGKEKEIIIVFFTHQRAKIQLEDTCEKRDACFQTTITFVTCAIGER